MVKLTTNYDNRRAEFYFISIENCNKFKKKFADHWCNVEWNKPEIADDFPGAHSDYWKKHINDDPVKLADESLMWGFSLLKFIGKDELTSDQKHFVENFIKENKL